LRFISVNQLEYKIGDKVRFFCKYSNEIVIGEIINIRSANLNWDYQVRYEIYINLNYVQWIAEEYIVDKIKK